MSTLAILLCLVWIVADLGSLSTYFLVVKVIVHRADFPADSGERELSHQSECYCRAQATLLASPWHERESSLLQLRNPVVESGVIKQNLGKLICLKS